MLRPNLLLLPLVCLPGLQLVSFAVEEDVQSSSLLNKTNFLLVLVRSVCVGGGSVEGRGGGESVSV